MKRDPNKLAMWREMRKYYIRVESRHRNDFDFIILADFAEAAIANLWIRELNRYQYATKDELQTICENLSFRTQYIVHEGCFDDGHLVDSAPILSWDSFYEADRRGIAAFIKAQNSQAVYQAWKRRVLETEPSYESILE